MGANSVDHFALLVVTLQLEEVKVVDGLDHKVEKLELTCHVGIEKVRKGAYRC